MVMVWNLRLRCLRCHVIVPIYCTWLIFSIGFNLLLIHVKLIKAIEYMVLYFYLYLYVLLQSNFLFGDSLSIFQRLHCLWKKRFGEEVDEDLIYVVAVERVLQIENFKEVNWYCMFSCYDS